MTEEILNEKNETLAEHLAELRYRMLISIAIFFLLLTLLESLVLQLYKLSQMKLRFPKTGD